MNDLYKSASDHDKIVSVMCGWYDEHIHTEFLSSEGMNRVWLFQRTLINAMVTAREASEVVSYRTRHGGEGGLELIEGCDLESLGSNAKDSALKKTTNCKKSTIRKNAFNCRPRFNRRLSTKH